MIKIAAQKQGKITTRTITNLATSLIVIIIILKVYSIVVAEGIALGLVINGTGVPLGGFFVGNGLIWLIVIASLLLLIIRNLIVSRKR